MNAGKQGEAVVAQWIVACGGKILHHRWRWQRGEIDLIALAVSDSKLCDTETLLFIEVKTRDRSNWDTDGLLAIGPQKQAKILSTAAVFLLKEPHFADYPCRFDVAIVRHQPINREIVGTPLHVAKDLPSGKSWLVLDYIAGAFDEG
jgi:putative endonuclease